MNDVCCERSAERVVQLSEKYNHWETAERTDLI
jgi:hypothetical protein